MYRYFHWGAAGFGELYVRGGGGVWDTDRRGLTVDGG